MLRYTFPYEWSDDESMDEEMTLNGARWKKDAFGISLPSKLIMKEL